MAGLGAVVVVGLMSVSSPAHATAPGSTGGATVTVADAGEAWYASMPIASCSSPVGCPPVALPSTSSPPPDTLRVAVSEGSETARTYVEPDLSQVPAGATAISGTMTLPVSTMSNAGNANVSSATFVACLVTAPFTDGTDGSTAPPPATSCRVSAPARYLASATQPTFRVDLTPFLAAWNSGAPSLGIALIPATTGETPLTSWQVVFNGRKLAGVPHIASVLLTRPSVPHVVGQTGSATKPPTTTAAGPQATIASGTSGPGPQPIPSVPPAPTGPTSGPLTTTSPFAPTAETGPVGPQTLVAPASGLPSSSGLQPMSGLPPTTSNLAQGPGEPLSAGPATGTGVISQTSSTVGYLGFRYPEVMLLPLAFLMGLVYLARTFTSDATPGRASRRSS